MNEPKRMSLYWLLAVAFIVSVVVFDIAYGDEGHGHHHDDSGDVTVDVIGGDASSEIGGDSSKVYALSGGDMDIDDCLATYSVAFGLFQGTNINRLCEAERLNTQGKYQAAAEMKCSLFRFKRIYGKGQNCIDAVIFTKPTEIVPQTPQDDARIAALYARINAVEAQRVQDKAEAEKAVETANMAAQRANAMAKRVQQAPDDGSIRRAMAREARQKVFEDKE